MQATNSGSAFICSFSIFSKLFVLLIVASLFFASTNQVIAQSGSLPSSLNGVGLEEKLGEIIPLSTLFLDEQGQSVLLSEFFDGEIPVILNFVYHDCPMLCSIVLESFTETIKQIPWTPGDEFKVLTISFSSIETPEMASAVKERIILKLGKPDAAAGWHFLTGSQESIDALTASVGFQFKWIESTQEFAHPSALIFMSGEGLITRYINGINYPSADVRRAIVEASQGQVGSPLDQVLLYCYRYDPDSNSYVLHATNLMKIGGLFTLLIMGLGMFIFWRRERHKQNASITQP